jgi:K(+)-stimulated pyrophosphate-energized sodium pump
LVGWGDRRQSRWKSVTGWALFVCGLIGLGVTGLIVVITEYYTGSGKRPVVSIAQASVTGHGTNVIQGLAVSMESTALPAIVIVAASSPPTCSPACSASAIAVTTMLALAGMIVALDAFGPVTDNAGGIAEMAGLPKDVRHSTDALDAVGNTTKAVTKGYAIGSAGLGALVLFAAYTNDLKHFVDTGVPTSRRDGVPTFDFSLANPYVVVGLFFGGLICLPVRRHRDDRGRPAAGSVVMEVRRQFKEMPGIMLGTQKPDYGRAVDMLTKAAIREMIVPSLLPVLAPFVVYFGVLLISAAPRPRPSPRSAPAARRDRHGLFVAISMTSGGGAWDNAKK